MKILIAQGDELSRNLLRTTLGYWGNEVVVTEDGTQAWQELQKPGGPRVAVLDRNLTGLDGLEVCRRVRQLAAESYVYLFLTTTQGHEQEITEGMQAGADDFLAKPLNADELMVRLRIGKRILGLQDELRQAQGAIRYQTTHDPLTGLVNRAAVVDTLQRELARVRREGSHIGIILAEVDRFKEINETYGHAAGDAVLREAARRIRSMVRPYDTVGRYGGEEFLVIVPGCDVQPALNQAERLRAALAGQNLDVAEWGKFASAQDGKIGVTLSLGVATADKTTDAEPLLRAAEGALARAKQAGRNRVELATESGRK
jgi:two-component system cell cycle response regulator